MRVLDGVTGGCRCIVRSIARHRIFRNCVDDVHSAALLVQVCKGCRPRVARIQSLAQSGVGAIGIQSDNDFGSPQSVSVVIIFPNLLHGYVDRLCFRISTMLNQKLTQVLLVLQFFDLIENHIIEYLDVGSLHS